MDEVIKELQTATGWKDIYMVDSTYVLRFDLPDIRVIKGLKQNDNCLFLDFESFKKLPISFLVTAGTSVHQYWVIGRNLHRVGDRPAYISIDRNTGRIIRRWHWNGILHRTTGPAKEMVRGLKAEDTPGFEDTHTTETWETMSLEWCHEGFQCRYPMIGKAELDRGNRIRSKRTGLLESPRPDLAAFYTEFANLEWYANLMQDIRPATMELAHLRECYGENQSLLDRDASNLSTRWMHGTDMLGDLTAALDEEIRTGDLLTIVDLWGKFFPDAEAEFLFVAEYDRVKAE